ncbi:MAG: ATP-binding cassette domain-containing protein [Planctomycetota bacterium]|nr:MAG: ATP-binding cassette domain-containing protein [Planctomycetota bacterium]
MVNDYALELRNVTKRFGDFTAVDDVSLEIPKGAVYGFLGPNGAGKTTTIRMILEIFKPDSGSISVLGQPSALLVRNRIGYLPEEKGLYKKMKAWSIIAYFASLKGMNRKEAKKKAYSLLERYGLADFADHKTEALSKGMGQKVQVLASIAHDPDFVILDEPFSGLDPVNQQVMEEVIEDMRKRGQTVIFSTHVMSHAERICDRILLIAKGKKIFDGSIPEAKRVIPKRWLLHTRGRIDALGDLPGIRGMVEIPIKQKESPEPIRAWQLRVSDDLNFQSVLQACVQNGIVLERFDQTEPSLHDVFVHMVGDEAKEATFR